MQRQSHISGSVPVYSYVQWKQPIVSGVCIQIINVIQRSVTYTVGLPYFQTFSYAHGYDISAYTVLGIETNKSVRVYLMVIVTIQVL